MYFTRAALAFGACAFQLGVAAVSFTEWPHELHPGEPATVKWSGAESGVCFLSLDMQQSRTDHSQPLTITLCKGKATDLQQLKTITADVDGEDESFTWTPQDSLKDGPDYALAISQKDQKNYSGHFSVSHDKSHIPPGKGPNPSSTTSASSTTGTGGPEGTVAKGNTADGDTDALSESLISGKTVSHDEQTGGASFHGVSVRLALGAVAAIFFFTT